MLHYKTFLKSPDAEWVVFVHGAGGSSNIWHKQIRAFRRHYNLLLPDLRGHGESRERVPPESDALYTFEEISGELLEVMDDAGVPAAHFVGISLGCILIRTLAEMGPERVRSMVLGGAILHLNFRSRTLVALGRVAKPLVPFLWLYRLFAWIIMPRKRHQESRMLFVGEAKKVARREFMRWFPLAYRLNPRMRRFEEQELAIPTLYLMGSEDYMFLPPVRRLVERQPATSRLVVLEDSGHVCNVDQPEAFNREALAFLQQHTLEPSR